MRYTDADFFERIEGREKHFYAYCGYGDDDCNVRETLKQALFCRSDKGTGVNDKDRKPWPKAGDATPGCGNSLGYIRISDRYDSLGAELIQRGCLDKKPK